MQGIWGFVSLTDEVFVNYQLQMLEKYYCNMAFFVIIYIKQY